MIGHVAQIIKTDPSSPDAPVLAEIEANVRPYIAKWPPMTNWYEYMSASTNDYNTMLNKAVLPGIKYQLISAQTSQLLCPAFGNDMAMRISKNAILASPLKFAGHAFIHYLGLWSFAFLTDPLPATSAEARLSAAAGLEQTQPRGVPDLWRTSQERVAALAPAIVPRLRELSLSFDNHQLEWGVQLGVAIGLAATVLAAFATMLHRLTPAMAALVASSLLTSGYFAVHSLFQPALFRYTAACQFGIVAILVLLGHAVATRLRDVWRRTAVVPRAAQSKDDGIILTSSNGGQ